MGLSEDEEDSLLVSTDDFWHPEFISTLLKALIGNPGVIVDYSPVLLVEEDGVTLGGQPKEQSITQGLTLIEGS